MPPCVSSEPGPPLGPAFTQLNLGWHTTDYASKEAGTPTVLELERLGAGTTMPAQRASSGVSDEPGHPLGPALSQSNPGWGAEAAVTRHDSSRSALGAGTEMPKLRAPPGVSGEPGPPRGLVPHQSSPDQSATANATRRDVEASGQRPKHAQSDMLARRATPSVSDQPGPRRGRPLVS